MVPVYDITPGPLALDILIDAEKQFATEGNVRSLTPAEAHERAPCNRGRADQRISQAPSFGT